MKKSLISGIVGSMALLSLCACYKVMTPQPIADANAAGLGESISYYGDIELFDEKAAPLMVLVTAPAASKDGSFAAAVKDALTSSSVNCVAPGTPYDIKLSVKSDYQELTPAPQCRMSHLLTISVDAYNGSKLQPSWSHKTETLQACTSAVAAKNNMKPQIEEVIKDWEKNHFSNEAGKLFKVSVVRFRTSRKVIEFNPTRFEKDLRVILNRLRRFNGVVDVRMIEADKENRIASFRVLYRQDILGKNKIKK